MTDPQPAPQKSVAKFIRDVVLVLVAAILISMVIKAFFFRSFFIPSESMESTLMVNDRIIANELVPDVVPLERGDVVVFVDPGGWLPPQPETAPDPLQAVLSLVGLSDADSNQYLIKRVIGLPGDHVAGDGLGPITVNGVPLDEPYLNLAGPSGSEIAFDVTVPEGRVWVMGDNRRNSRDSRYHQEEPGKGTVPVSGIVGRAVVVSWPLDRWAWLDNHPDVFSDVDEQG
jgi:signal peptidase I